MGPFAFAKRRGDEPNSLREGRGEIEAGATGELPELVTVDDIRAKTGAPFDVALK